MTETLDYTHCTPETIAAAKAACEAERRALEALTGCTISPEGHVRLPGKGQIPPTPDRRPERPQ